MEHLHRLLLELPVREWIFYGYSMGGRLLLEYLKGDRCLRPYWVFLESVAPGGGPDPERYQRDQLLAQRLEKSTGTSFLHDWYAQPLFAGMGDHPHYDRYITGKDPEHCSHWARALEAFSVSQQRSCFEYSLELPGSYICGADDQRYRRLGLEFVRQWGWQYHCLSDASHNVHFFHAEQIKHLVAAVVAEMGP